jgi:hypothetical protein
MAIWPARRLRGWGNGFFQRDYFQNVAEATPKPAVASESLTR